jgi:hypothetical protein
LKEAGTGSKTYNPTLVPDFPKFPCIVANVRANVQHNIDIHLGEIVPQVSLKTSVRWIAVDDNAKSLGAMLDQIEDKVLTLQYHQLSFSSKKLACVQVPNSIGEQVQSPINPI